MYKSPNSYKKAKFTTGNNPYARGDNNLNARLQKAIRIILSKEYYEGSDNGQYYNKKREDGKSWIYVDQPDIENDLQRGFIDEDSDCVKYLVGPTGIGKTTLIRNMFKVFDRKAVLNTRKIDDGKGGKEEKTDLIIYISFYSMMNSENDGNFDSGNAPIIKTISTALREAIDLVDGTTLKDRIKNRTVDFYKDFYGFVEGNNKLMGNAISDFDIDEEEARKASCIEKYILNQMEKSEVLDYNMSLFKYYLNKYEKKNDRLFDNIILILDDIESVGKIGKGIAENAYHIRKCLQAYKSSHVRYHIKCLVAMRNYSFRNDILVYKEANRTYIGTDFDNKEDIILKDTAPSLEAIISKRVDYILNHNEVVALYSDRDSYLAAANILKIVLKKVYGKYDKMLLYLTHYNIFSSMTLLFRIITNSQFIGKFEMDRAKNDGSFVLSEKDYSFDNASGDSLVPGNIDVFYALVYGENDLYFDLGNDYYLTNIMHFKETDHLDTELLGIYIIQYFIAKKINLADNDYDGLKTINVMTALNEMTTIYDFHTGDDKLRFWNGMHRMLKNLYLGGALRQSLISPIEKKGTDSVREYSDELNVYLSTRGFQLYNMLTYNSLLLSVYRDDIDTKIENNDKATTEISKSTNMMYCIKYINHLVDKEMNLFRQVKKYKTYEETFGSTLATVALLKGIEQSITNYYLLESAEKEQVIASYNEISKKINRNIVLINKRHETKFETVRLL